MSITIPHLTRQLVDSYEKVGGINHLDGKNLPSKSVVAAITVDLLRLLFPGFFDNRSLHSSELESETATVMEMVAARLETEIFKSIEYASSSEENKAKSKDQRRAAHGLTMNFLAKLPSIREILRTDVEAAYNGDPAALSQDEIIVAYPFVEAISVQRLAHELYRQDVALIPRIMTEWAHTRTGMDLHPGARIGSYFFVDHCTGTVVGETCDIGNHVKVYHGVTLGAKSTSNVEALRGVKRHPTIQDHVTIYPGATILGGDTVIGTGSTIGGNVFLTHSIPPDSLVVFEGVTVRILSKHEHSKAGLQV